MVLLKLSKDVERIEEKLLLNWSQQSSSIFICWHHSQGGQNLHGLIYAMRLTKKTASEDTTLSHMFKESPLVVK